MFRFTLRSTVLVTRCFAPAAETQLPKTLPTSDPSYHAWMQQAIFAAYAVFWSGISVGLTNLGSG